MKKFAIGYNIYQHQQITKAINQFKDYISDVYCAWPQIQSGRCKIPIEFQQQMIEDLRYYSSLGIKFNLLYNGMCYGEQMISNKFFNQLDNIVNKIINSSILLDSITCISPIIAAFIKRTYRNFKTVASVNTQWHFTEQFNYMKQYFDAFYIARQYNRDLNKIKQFSKWCKENGKQLYTLANSGCISFCAYHIIHQQLMNHVKLCDPNNCTDDIHLVCQKQLLNQPSNFFKISSFIRPQNLKLVDSYFDKIKLATRVSKFPYQIIKGYITNSYQYSLIDLLQPPPVAVYTGYEISNKKVDNQWYNYMLNCNKKCNNCNLCKQQYYKSLYKKKIEKNEIEIKNLIILNDLEKNKCQQ